MANLVYLSIFNLEGYNNRQRMYQKKYRKDESVRDQYSYQQSSNYEDEN